MFAFARVLVASPAKVPAPWHVQKSVALDCAKDVTVMLDLIIL